MSASAPAPALESLKRPLAFAAREGFAHLDKVRDLGPTLRAALDRVLAALPNGAEAGALGDWRCALDRFEVASRGERELLVARGLRLVAMMADGRAIAARPAGRPAAKPRAAGTFTDPVGVLPGCGPKVAQLLGARGVRTVGDLLLVIPRRYEDRRAVRSVAALAGVADGVRVV